MIYLYYYLYSTCIMYNVLLLLLCINTQHNISITTGLNSLFNKSDCKYLCLCVFMFYLYVVLHVSVLKNKFRMEIFFKCGEIFGWELFQVGTSRWELFRVRTLPGGNFSGIRYKKPQLCFS